MTTTTATRNIETIQEIYGAFARGDIAGIKSRVADDVDWGLGIDESIRGDAGGFLANWRTSDGVDAYFASVAEELEFHAFSPVGLVADGDVVLSRLQLEVTGRRTGRRVQLGEIHEFEFDADGRIVRYRPYIDTATLLSVLR
jgi:ketosteroid isomerase-like protein